MHADIQRLLRAIDLEEKEQTERYRLDQTHSLKLLKAEGLAIHPISIIRKSFGYAEYPEITFRIRFPGEYNLFRDGVSIECFIPGEEPVKGILLTLDGKQGEIRLYAPDYPMWIDDDGVGIKLAPDTRTTTIMKKVLHDLSAHKKMLPLFEKIHGRFDPSQQEKKIENKLYHNLSLNASQNAAVNALLDAPLLTIIHGPPGTGKTTTLIAAIKELTNRGEKIIITAPSNTAVDHLAHGLITEGVNVLRLGNVTKVHDDVYDHTPESLLQNSTEYKEIKELRKRADEFRRMANKYHRKFGKDEKEQRNLLLQEIKNIRGEIKKLQSYFEAKLFNSAQVIAGTPIGLYDAHLPRDVYSTLVMDEAGQCIEPLAWCVFPFADRHVLGGDHFQLPPTVLSHEAMSQGLNLSILEVCIQSQPPIHLLDTQYRMRPSIAEYSNLYFYNGRLKSANHLIDADGEDHIIFIDTAGTGMQEARGADGVSLQNSGELDIANKIIESNTLPLHETAFISPYAGQILAAKESLPKGIRMSTVDSFQGQEMYYVIVSLVRSNDDGVIGFLKDYRRMNVAITRTKYKLWVIGDSATIGNDAFYGGFLEYVEKNGSYQSGWEYMD